MASHAQSFLWRINCISMRRAISCWWNACGLICPENLITALKYRALAVRVNFWHSLSMSTLAQKEPGEALLDANGWFEKLIDKLRFPEAAEEWSRCVSRLSSWEA